MNINLLKAFIAIVDAGSFSKAAERLFISQPALSQNMKQLENYFTVSLIKRTPHNLTLTEAGTLLYNHAVKLVEMCELMEEDMNAFRASLNDTVLVGATTIIGGYAVPCSIFIFKSKYPEAKVKLKLGNRRQILDQLREDIIDIAVIEGDRPDENFVASEIHTEEMVVIAPNNGQWKNHTALGLEEFLQVPLIMREEGSATRSSTERTLQQAGIRLENLTVVMELNSVDSIKAAVEAGHGVSVLPRMAVKKELYNKTLCALRIDKLLFMQPIHIVYKRKARPTVASEFIKLMKSTTKGFC